MMLNFFLFLKEYCNTTDRFSRENNNEILSK